MISIRDLSIGIVALLASGCGRSGSGADGAPVVVTVSIPPQAWFVEAIAGDSVEVNVLLSAGANPETFEPGVSAMKQAGDSKAIFITGGMSFETAVARKLSGADSGLKVVDTSRGIELLYGTHDHCEAHGHAHRHTGAADPHTWTSVKNGKIIARNVVDALVEIDPARAGYYKNRYDALALHLDSLDTAIAERLAPVSGSSFLVMHPSLGYFARDYGLEQVSVGSEGRESSVQGLRRQLDLAAGSGVRVLFLQADFDSRQAETVAAHTATNTVTLNLLNPDWEEEINRIADALSPSSR